MFFYVGIHVSRHIPLEFDKWLVINGWLYLGRHTCQLGFRKLVALAAPAQIYARHGGAVPVSTPAQFIAVAGN